MGKAGPVAKRSELAGSSEPKPCCHPAMPATDKAPAGAVSNRAPSVEASEFSLVLAPAKAALPPLSAKLPVLAPVSYTHLDVYKRQPR